MTVLPLMVLAFASTLILAQNEPQENEVQLSSTCLKNGYVRDDSDCNRYYKCIDDGDGGFVKVQFKCDANQFWDEEINACNDEQKIKNPKCTVTISDVKSTTKRSPGTSLEEISDQLMQFWNNFVSLIKSILYP